jgi:hypothetical protein
MTTHILRSVGLALALAGCAGPIRPAVGPALSSLPDEPGEREEQLASAAARPSPETGRSLSEAQRAEGAAAGLAAFLGMIFSSTPNAFVGFAVPIEETPRPRAEEAEPPAEQAWRSSEPLLEIRAPSPKP